MDRAKVKMLRKAMEEALAPLEESFKVKLLMDNCNFTESYCNFKVGFADVAEDGEVQSKEVKEFKMFAATYGLEPTDLYRTFTVRGTEYKITGLSTRKPKYPLLADRVRDGAKFKFPVDQVVMALKE